MKQLEKSDIEKLTAYTYNTQTTIDCEIKLFALSMSETISNKLKVND